MKIGIVIGSIRQGRKGEAVGRWVERLANERGGAQFELIDVASYDLPPLTAETLPAMAKKQYDSPQVTRWSQAIDACDGYVFVTPEYNHSVPGAFKNAVDLLGSEWTGKSVGFVSYGAEAGVRAVEHWRQIIANFSMIDVRQQVSMSAFAEFSNGEFTPNDRRAGELATMLQQLIAAVARQQSA